MAPRQIQSTDLPSHRWLDKPKNISPDRWNPHVAVVARKKYYSPSNFRGTIFCNFSGTFQWRLTQPPHEKFVALVTASSIFQRGWYGWVENHYTEDAYHKCTTIVNYSSYCYCYLIIVIAIGTAIVVFIVIYYHAFIWWENHCNMYRIMNHSIFNLIFWRAIFQLMVRLLESTHLKNDVRNQGQHEFNMNFRSQNQGLFSGGGVAGPIPKRGPWPARGRPLEERDLNETYAFEFASSWSCLKLSRGSVDQSLISRWSKATPQRRASFP